MDRLFKSPKSKYSIIAGTCILISCVAAFIMPADHDYWLYTFQWDNFLSHNQPSPYYGPLFNVFAYPYSLHAKLPAVIFVFAFAWFFYKIIDSIQDDQERPSKYYWYAIFFLNPLFVLFSIKFGSNDSFVAATMLASILFFQKKERFLSILSMVFGILFKIIPLFILPFLTLKKKNKDLIYSAWVISLSIGSFIGARMIWGPQALSVFKPNEEVVSKMFSIFRFIRGEYSPIEANLDHLSIPLMLAALSVYFIIHFWKNLDSLISITIAISLCFLFYKVGHHQYYISLLSMVIICSYQYWNECKRHFRLIFSTTAFFLFIFVLTIMYSETAAYGGRFQSVREWMGLPSFVLHAWLSVELILFNLKISRLQSNAYFSSVSKSTDH